MVTVQPTGLNFRVLSKKKPVVLAHKPQIRFGNEENKPAETIPVAQPVKSAKGGRAGSLVHWVMTALMGATATTALVQNQATHNSMTSGNQQLQGQLAQRDADLAALQARLDRRIGLDQIVNVVNRVTPATVRVEGSAGLGSGVIIQDTRGRLFILTNGHVTEDNQIVRPGQQEGVYHIKVYNGSDNQAPLEFDAAPVMLANGQRAQSSSEHHDLCLLQIPPDVRLPAHIRPVQMRDITRNPLQVGETVVAVGNPYGNRDSVSSGIISHTDRNFRLEPMNRFLQTDAPINPGNSGGGLFDLEGRLIGINTLGYRGADGLGGSIRIDVVKAVLESWGVPVLAEGERPFTLPQAPAPRPNPFGFRIPTRKADTPSVQTPSAPSQSAPKVDAKKD